MLEEYRRHLPQRHREDVQAFVRKTGTNLAETESPDNEIALAIWCAQTTLATELLNQIHAREPVFFEDLVIDVLLAMGYGTRRRDLTRRLGRSSDGGVDGLISVDELGLDPIYLQAKRLKPGNAVPVSEVRDFAGSLDAHRASKGIFVATSHFSAAAASFCQQVSRRVALVDGVQFAELMIRHNVGVSVQQSYQIKRLDPDYFRRGITAR
jgi:restriction system protein